MKPRCGDARQRGSGHGYYFSAEQLLIALHWHWLRGGTATGRCLRRKIASAFRVLSRHQAAQISLFGLDFVFPSYINRNTSLFAGRRTAELAPLCSASN